VYILGWTRIIFCLVLSSGLDKSIINIVKLDLPFRFINGTWCDY